MGKNVSNVFETKKKKLNKMIYIKPTCEIQYTQISLAAIESTYCASLIKTIILQKEKYTNAHILHKCTLGKFARVISSTTPFLTTTSKSTANIVSILNLK